MPSHTVMALPIIVKISGLEMVMKRDMDLIRAILMEVESQPVNHLWSAKPLLTFSVEEVVYHVRLAQDDGLVDARIAPGEGMAVVLRLTSAGHEFLEAARSETVWEKAKSKALEATGSLTLQALKVALQIMIDQLLKR